MHREPRPEALVGVGLGGLGAVLLPAALVGVRDELNNVNFFHTRPYNSLKIARANGLITTVLLLLVGLVVGEVVERGRRSKDRLRDGQRELRRLHRVAVAATAVEDDRDLVLTVTAELIDTLHLKDCQFERPPFGGELPRLEPDGTITGVSRGLHAARGFELPPAGVELRVVGRRAAEGRFVLIPTPGIGVSPEGLLVAIALARELGLAFGTGA
ncbi:MAG: DUF4118 domain-containing protein [Acidimicrobiales bacterium]